MYIYMLDENIIVIIKSVYNRSQRLGSESLFKDKTTTASQVVQAVQSVPFPVFLAMQSHRICYLPCAESHLLHPRSRILMLLVLYKTVRGNLVSPMRTINIDRLPKAHVTNAAYPDCRKTRAL